MEKRITKKEIVKVLLNQDLEIEDEEQLMDILLSEPITIDVDKEADQNLSVGDRTADKLTEIAGSWKFIIGFCAFLLLWILINVIFASIDPYPFTFLNLLLSCIAAIQAPIIMMSQNREAKRDSMRAKNDYRTNLKSELILEELHKDMTEIIKNQKKLMKNTDTDNTNSTLN
jgi:uncharacterized membrane protein